MISDGVKSHYCCIRNFNRLLASKTEKSHHSMHYCRRCLIGYRSINSLNKHTEYCSQHNAQKIELPEPGTMLNFKNYNRSMRVPFIVYADFESFIEPIDSCKPNPNMSYTNKYQKHTPSSFCYQIKCLDNDIYSQKPVSYTAKSKNDDVAKIFVDSLESDIKRIYKKFSFPKKMMFDKEDEDMYNAATTCHICDGELGEDRVRDHCHFSGKFRGAAHNTCNINYKAPTYFPVVLHNLSGLSFVY